MLVMLLQALHGCDFCRETSLSKLGAGGNSSVGSVIKLVRLQLVMLGVPCTRIYLESLDYYGGKSVIEFKKK